MAYGRNMQGPQGGGGYNPYSKYPDIGGLVQQFMQNMMMKKQMEQGQQQQMWQRGMEKQKFASQDAYRQAQIGAMGQPQKPPALPARVQEAIAATGQGGVPQEKINWKPVGMKLDEWRAKPEKEELDFKDNKYSQRKKLIGSLKSRVNKEITALKPKIKGITIEGDEPTPEEMVLITARQEAEGQSNNLKKAIDFIGRMEFSLEGGTFGERQSSVLANMIGNFDSIKDGSLMERYRASLGAEGGLTPQTQRKQFKNKKTGKLDWFRWDGSKWIKE